MEELSVLSDLVPEGSHLTGGFLMACYIDSDGKEWFTHQALGGVPKSQLAGRLMTILVQDFFAKDDDDGE